MAETPQIVTLSPHDHDAVLFDLDGVLTRTDRVHAAAWKELFDAFLDSRSKECGEPFVPFDPEADYYRHVDGKPRQDGVSDFLASRGIELPRGSPGDAPGTATVHGLGALKDEYFLRRLETLGVEVFEDSIAFVRDVLRHGLRTAVVSSSSNCAAVLEVAGIAELFEVRVDGLDLARLGIPGKPAPDAFLEAAGRLGVEPARAVVVEDAISGVQAGRAGGFGCVVGVDRGGRSLDLRAAGADVVVTSLAELGLGVERPSPWTFGFDSFDPARERTREALCTTGNGYFATRGASPGAVADGVHYPGTYVACLYDRLESEVEGRVVENEDLVNLPNWLHLALRIGDGPWFDEREVEILSYRQELDVRRGVLRRRIRFQDGRGRRSLLEERRFVSMDDMHLGAIEVALEPEDWSGPVTVRSGIDGRVLNTGAWLYGRFDPKHLEPVAAEVAGGDSVFLEVRTRGTAVRVAQAARTRVLVGERAAQVPREPLVEPDRVSQTLTVEVAPGARLRVEKVASLYTSRDDAIAAPGFEARRAVARAKPFAELLAAHVRAWQELWRRFDVHVDPPDPGRLAVQTLLRLHMFHLLETVSLHSIGLDVGVPARGWTGEAYQGHVFWDELFIFPFFNLRVPEITRSLLMYRYRRLGEARAAARAAGYDGAMFPWQSGSNGEEVTQKANLNPRSLRWVPDNTHLQRHVGSAVAYNVWQYYQVTEDVEFLEFYGAELILDVAQFWSSIARFDEARGRYVITGVMGPDEFHDAHPGAPEPGLANNAYTNVMAVWVLSRALDVLDLVSGMRRAELVSRLGITRGEIARWEDMRRRMFVPFHDGVISQFEGYGDLLELDWDDYRRRYRDLQRLELILEAEGDSANRYKVSKQPDALMLFYLFSADELRELFEGLGYELDADAIPRNVAYYARRTSHGSTLSRVVMAWILARSDRRRAMCFFAEALQSDVADIQGGTTAEGVHLGAMAGTVDIFERMSTGIETSGDVLRFNPRIPEDMDFLSLRIRYRGHSLDVRVTRDRLTVRGRTRGPRPIRIALRDDVREFPGGGAVAFSLAP